MDRFEEIKQMLSEGDRRTIDDRARRMSEVINYVYDGVYSPTNEYLEELDKLYINGHYMATIIFACSIVEYLLRRELMWEADESTTLSI